MAEDIYETKDLWFAAFLNIRVGVEGVRFENIIDPLTGHKKKLGYFLFPRVSNLSDLKSQYFSGKAQVSALEYVDSYRNLRLLLRT